MASYLSRRLLRAVVLVFAVSMLSFCLFELAPGDYFDEMRTNPAVTSETIEALRKKYGADEPAVTRYISWMASVIRGEWGYSIAYNAPAGPLLRSRAVNTLLLTGSAAFCAWMVAVPFAIWSASGAGFRQVVASWTVAVLLSLPEIVVILLLIGISAHFGWFSTGGMTSLDFGSMTLCERVMDFLSHVAVPLIALVLSSLPPLILHTRTAFIEALNSPFIRFARTNGIPHNRILIRHALPAAANPMITLLGLSTGTLLSSSLLVEAIAGWPGLGHLLLQALLQRDLLVVGGCVLLSSVFLVAGNLLADLLLYATDPRIRQGN